jgi:hypothetical protein
MDDIIVKLMFERLGKNEEDKLNEIEQYSNIDIVRRNARRLNLNKVYPSTRKNKKYMIRNPYSNKFIHFGLLGYSDYTKHLDIFRRDNFRKRNKEWKDAEIYTPSFLSYYLTW